MKLLALEPTILIYSKRCFLLCKILNSACVAASGILKGFDPLLNLVLDGTTEYLRGK